METEKVACLHCAKKRKKLVFMEITEKRVKCPLCFNGKSRIIVK